LTTDKHRWTQISKRNVILSPSLRSRINSAKNLGFRQDNRKNWINRKALTAEVTEDTEKISTGPCPAPLTKGRTEEGWELPL
jgi:hypothetical protein